MHIYEILYLKIKKYVFYYSNYKMRHITYCYEHLYAALYIGFVNIRIILYFQSQTNMNRIIRHFKKYTSLMLFNDFYYLL